MFRPLTSKELDMAETIAKRDGVPAWVAAHLNKLSVAYVYQGNFTIALITDGVGIGVGVAKRNPVDEDNQAVGQARAFVAAARADAVNIPDRGLMSTPQHDVSYVYTQPFTKIDDLARLFLGDFPLANSTNRR